MTNALKGALYSGLIYPGVGQIMLQRTLRGTVLLLGFSAGLLILIVKAVHQAMAILETMLLEGGAITMNVITDAASQSVGPAGSFTVTLLLFCLLGCWVAGIIDAYSIGRAKDIAEALPGTIIHKQ